MSPVARWLFGRDRGILCGNVWADVGSFVRRFSKCFRMFHGMISKWRKCCKCLKTAIYYRRRRRDASRGPAGNSRACKPWFKKT